MTDHDLWIDRDLDDYYSDTEEDIVDDDDWMIDVYVEKELEMENYYD